MSAWTSEWEYISDNLLYFRSDWYRRHSFGLISGNPKGVMLTHKNFVSQILSSRLTLGNLVITPNDVHISYLPLAHVFERVVSNILLAAGGAIGFYFSYLSLFNDIAVLIFTLSCSDFEVLKPTLFVSVPRVLNTLYEKTMALASSEGIFSRSMFQLAYQAKADGLMEGTIFILSWSHSKGYVTHSVWDKLVFPDIRSKLGGRVRMILTGSAPISPLVMDFLRICFACPVIEGLFCD